MENFNSYKLNLKSLSEAKSHAAVFNFAMERLMGDVRIDLLQDENSEIGVWDAGITLNENGFVVDGADAASGGRFNIAYHYNFDGSVKEVKFSENHTKYEITEADKKVFSALNYLNVEIDVHGEDSILEFFTEIGAFTKS